ncbi:uncharacterized protein LOC127256530 isoform X2 [Andrographis paniculata]|uniref:uncharacterized protein LOC127256530 isoform X2 n=1 Tax=Andrographis paniculata TaxID=175694 RepID=UPI0021E85D80|nr:uncharacterized protein LOC127256530 isoform X2 [Andrographis paniculata]
MDSDPYHQYSLYSSAANPSPCYYPCYCYLPPPYIPRQLNLGPLEQQGNDNWKVYEKEYDDLYQKHNQDFGREVFETYEQNDSFFSYDTNQTCTLASGPSNYRESYSLVLQRELPLPMSKLSLEHVFDEDSKKNPNDVSENGSVAVFVAEKVLADSHDTVECSKPYPKKNVLSNAVECAEPDSKKEVLSIIGEMLNLSDLLLLHFSNNSFSMEKENNETLKHIIRNLNSCLKGKFSQPTDLAPSNAMEVEDDDDQSSVGGTISFSSDTTKATKNDSEENFTSGGGSNLQALIYKSLWMKAEAKLSAIGCKTHFDKSKTQEETIKFKYEEQGNEDLSEVTSKLCESSDKLTTLKAAPGADNEPINDKGDEENEFVHADNYADGIGYESTDEYCLCGSDDPSINSDWENVLKDSP